MTEMDRLIDRYLDQDLSDDELADLFEWVAADSANADSFAAQTLLDQHTRELLKDTEVLFVSETSERDNKPRHRIQWIAAALMTVALLLFAVFQPDDDGHDVRPENAIATVAYESHARLSDRECFAGDLIGIGVLELEVGIVRLDFTNGAMVTLQGPARFEIIDGARTRLDSGILTTSIPESAVGFEVLTPAMEVVDLGTAFGVSVGTDGETDVFVFEGEVEVNLSESEDAPQLVREGNAVRSRPEADSIDSVNYATERFEDAWPVTSGVLQATGLMKFVSPGPDFVPGRYEDSEHILVFPEREKSMRFLLLFKKVKQI